MNTAASRTWAWLCVTASACMVWPAGASAGVSFTLTELDAPSDFSQRTFANAINNDGSNDGHRLTGGTFSTLDTQLGGHYGITRPTAINNAGQVVGSVNGAYGFVTTPSVTAPGVNTWDIGNTDTLRPVTPALGPLLGINNLGVVVGTDVQGSFISYSTPEKVYPSPVPRRAIYRPVLDPSTASVAFANAVNDQGQIVGETSTGKAALLTPHGTLYWPNGQLVSPGLDFNDARNWAEQLGSTFGPQPFGPGKFFDIQISGQSGVLWPAVLTSGRTVAKSLSLGDPTRAFSQGGKLEIGAGAMLTALDGVTSDSDSVLSGGGTLSSAARTGWPTTAASRSMDGWTCTPPV